MPMNVKRILKWIMPVMILCALVVCCFTGVPVLPHNKDYSLDLGSAEGILLFFSENYVPILYFCISLVFGLIVLYLGISLQKKIISKQTISSAFLSLSMFILLSGIWMITDSTTLWFFSDTIDVNSIVLISFLSFMLMPIAFVHCVKLLIEKKWILVLEHLFCLNTTIFSVFVILKTNLIFYFFSLAVHHILIIVTVFLLVFTYFRSKKQIGTVRVPFGVFVFFAAIIFTLVLFLLNDTTLYPIAMSIGLISLAVSVFKYILDDTIQSYEEQIQSDVYKKMAYTDALCGIKNRNAFELAQKETAASEHLSYVVFDINNLKPINDKYGHKTGDYLIYAAAALIQDCFAALGECFRIGGDEFAVICIDQEPTVVRAALTELQHEINSYNQEHDIKIGLAYGAAFRSDPEETPEHLYQAADQEMYLCKQEQKRAVSQK